MRADAAAGSAARGRGVMRTPFSSIEMEMPPASAPLPAGADFSIRILGGVGGAGGTGGFGAFATGLEVTVSVTFQLNGGRFCRMPENTSSRSASRVKRFQLIVTSQLA